LEARQRRVMIRIFIFLLVFVYIAYWSYALLPPFDFGVIILFFAVFLSWTLLSETMIYQAPDVYVIEDEDRHTFLWLQLSRDFISFILYITCLKQKVWPHHHTFSSLLINCLLRFLKVQPAS
jgi:predicted histidine transporter YuiF (NhaC family)